MGEQERSQAVSGLSGSFNDPALDPLPKTAFVNVLQSRFDDTTARRVLTAFNCMGIDPPHDEEEFLSGTVGLILFLNPYGLVLRIEHTKLDEENSGVYVPNRINNSGYILHPLATIGAGDATIEVCPGCHLENKMDNVTKLYELLHLQRIDYWDLNLPNNGRLPVKTPSFPEGVPIVIDRLAVRKLSLETLKVSEALRVAADEALEAQRALYAPLKTAWKEGWPQKEKMGAFWQLCRDYVAEGKLVVGWKDYPEEGNLYGGFSKPYRARLTGQAYAGRLTP